MATTYTTKAKLGKPANNDTGWGTTLNTTIDALEAFTPISGLNVSLAEVPSASLNVRVAAGAYQKSDGTKGTYAGIASQAITLNTTKMLYLTDGGTLTVAASYPSTLHVPLATVVAGATTITSITDDRVMAMVVGSDAQPYLPLAGGTLADAANVAVGSTTGTKIATATTQKLAFYNSSPIVQRSGAAQAAVATTAATNTTPYGYTTAAQADAIVALANELRAALVALGLIKGSA